MKELTNLTGKINQYFPKPVQSDDNSDSSENDDDNEDLGAP